ncbi:MAG: hypothetical protein OXC81_02530, partial [Betaproteobacteria bacterium]|nr:hypothetical protein [Betaproteobacteria bacterium]
MTIEGKWIKKGLVFKTDKRSVWAGHSLMVPTPILLGDRIRIFAGFKNKEGVSRISFFDVSATNP